MNSDFEELLSTFNDRCVKYLVVGGHAVMLYSDPRYTKDLEIWVEASEENGAKVFQALAEFGAPLAGLTVRDFAAEGFFVKWEFLPRASTLLRGVISICMMLIHWNDSPGVFQRAASG